MKYFCEDCKSFFDEDEIEVKCVCRQTWDSPAEYEYYCPICGSEGIGEAGVCEFCKEPIDPDKKISFCDECEEYFTYMFEQMVEHIANEWGSSTEDAKNALLEFIAEKY